MTHAGPPPATKQSRAGAIGGARTPPSGVYSGRRRALNSTADGAVWSRLRGLLGLGLRLVGGGLRLLRAGGGGLDGGGDGGAEGAKVWLQGAILCENLHVLRRARGVVRQLADLLGERAGAAAAQQRAGSDSTAIKIV